MITYFLIIMLLMVAYRVRGSGLYGTTGGRVYWGLAVFCAAVILTGDYHFAAQSSMGALGGLLLSHSRYYQINSQTDFIAMVLIYAARLMMMVIWLPGEQALAAGSFGVVCALIHWGANLAQKTGITNDQLRMAEPAIGAAYGGFLWMICT